MAFGVQGKFHDRWDRHGAWRSPSRVSQTGVLYERTVQYTHNPPHYPSPKSCERSTGYSRDGQVQRIYGGGRDGKKKKKASIVPSPCHL